MDRLTGRSPQERSEAFGRDRRITERADFLRIYSKGRAYRTRGFVCHVIDTENRDQPSRLGVTVSKRVGRAHYRVRYKRWAREVFRRRLLRPGFDMVVTFRPEIASMDFAEFQSALSAILKQARINSEDDNTEPVHL